MNTRTAGRISAFALLLHRRCGATGTSRVAPDIGLLLHQEQARGFGIGDTPPGCAYESDEPPRYALQRRFA